MAAGKFAGITNATGMFGFVTMCFIAGGIIRHSITTKTQPHWAEITGIILAGLFILWTTTVMWQMENTQDGCGCTGTQQTGTSSSGGTYISTGTGTSSTPATGTGTTSSQRTYIQPSRTASSSYLM